MSWRTELGELAAAIGSQAKRGADALGRLVDRDPYQVVGYRGYGTGSRLLVLGRVLEHEGLAVPDPGHSKLRNLLAMLKRIESDPLPFARIRARLPEGVRELVADDEGFIRTWLDCSIAEEGWGAMKLELSQPPQGAAAEGLFTFLIPPSSAVYGVISDLDDTVLQSGVTDFIRAARTVLLENARTRLPFPGVAGFYRALVAGPTGAAVNPIFYVSSSPWNLYDVIAEFLEVQQIPQGPMLLRDWDIGPSLLRNASHKLESIKEILATYPSLPFILVGDSAQEDPEIYADIVATYPGRILAVYIRNIRPHPERLRGISLLAGQVQAAGSTLVLADDTLTAARHAAVHGWIEADALTQVGEEKQADEAGKEPAPGVEQQSAPTLVVDKDVGVAELD